MRSAVLLLALLCPAAALAGDLPPLLSQSALTALSSELSGETARRHLAAISQQHRMRGSKGYRAAAEYIAEQLRSYGLSEVTLNELPADGKIFYGTQRSRPAWDAEFAELWEVVATEQDWIRRERVASWEAMPMSLAQDSDSGQAMGQLVDVGAGSALSNYEGKDVAGKFVLTSQQPSEAAPIAIDQLGAAGIVSYAQNQVTAWWKEDETLVRWGHLDSFHERPQFAFMVSLERAKAWQARLGRGESVVLSAQVRAGRHPGAYTIVTASIPGADRADEEIIFSCHLDHPNPGANDNASGAASLLEIARTLQELIGTGRLPRPARTIRFVWPPEIEGTVALLDARPQWAARVRAAIHLDMVGGGAVTKAVFHVTRGPASLPSFVHDVAAVFLDFVNRQSAAHAGGERVEFPFVAPSGGKEALLGRAVDFTMGSDHQVYSEGSWRIPTVYLNDWPDRYIHTHKDLPANIDATKLLRSSFIAAATGWTLATLADREALWPVLRSASLVRTAGLLQRVERIEDAEQRDRERRFHLWQEEAVLASVERFVASHRSWQRQADAHLRLLAGLLGDIPMPLRASGPASVVYRRAPHPKGPMTVFGYDYLSAHLSQERHAGLTLLAHRGERGSGAEIAYEALNWVDGRRSVGEIHAALSANYGLLPLPAVLEYFGVLAELGILTKN
jgi:hypothetical protein